MSSLLLLILILQNTVIQAVRVIGGNVTVVQGDTAVLPCLLTESTESLRQITWERRTRQIKQNTNLLTILENNVLNFNGFNGRFSFIGDFSQGNGSLQLSNVTKSDDGLYTCIYTLFPSGNLKTEIPLSVSVLPEISVMNTVPIVGNEELVLASCTAAHSWPPTNIDWHLGELSDLLRIAHKSIENADGTVTTVSTLFGAPTRNLHNHSVNCVLKNPALPDGTTRPLTIQVHFPPSEVKINEISKNTFECVSEANPKANFTWSRTNLPWPNSAVKASGALLEIFKPSPQLNGLFECNATNTYGTNQGYLYLHPSVEGSCAVGWTLFCLLLLLNAFVAAMWYYRSDKKCSISWFNRSRESTPTTAVTRGTDTPSVEQGPELEPLRRQESLEEQQSAV